MEDGNRTFSRLVRARWPKWRWGSGRIGSGGPAWVRRRRGFLVFDAAVATQDPGGGVGTGLLRQPGTVLELPSDLAGAPAALLPDLEDPPDDGLGGRRGTGARCNVFSVGSKYVTRVVIERIPEHQECGPHPRSDTVWIV